MEAEAKCCETYCVLRVPKVAKTPYALLHSAYSNFRFPTRHPGLLHDGRGRSPAADLPWDCRPVSAGRSTPNPPTWQRRHHALKGSKTAPRPLRAVSLHQAGGPGRPRKRRHHAFLPGGKTTPRPLLAAGGEFPPGGEPPPGWGPWPAAQSPNPPTWRQHGAEQLCFQTSGTPVA